MAPLPPAIMGRNVQARLPHFAEMSEPGKVCAGRRASGEEVIELTRCHLQQPLDFIRRPFYALLRWASLRMSSAAFSAMMY